MLAERVVLYMGSASVFVVVEIPKGSRNTYEAASAGEVIESSREAFAARNAGVPFQEPDHA
jgi:hypothetical protein